MWHRNNAALHLKCQNRRCESLPSLWGLKLSAEHQNTDENRFNYVRDLQWRNTECFTHFPLLNIWQISSRQNRNRCVWRVQPLKRMWLWIRKQWTNSQRGYSLTTYPIYRTLNEPCRSSREYFPALVFHDRQTFTHPMVTSRLLKYFRILVWIGLEQENTLICPLNINDDQKSNRIKRWSKHLWAVSLVIQSQVVLMYTDTTMQLKKCWHG